MNNLLSPRFRKIVELLGYNKSVADIGCDHGIITEFLLKNKLAEHVFASDISSPSLQKAIERCRRFENAGFYLGSGFEPLPEKPDCALIAGMGGDIIAELIKNEKAKTKLVLQPMKDSDVLYKALVENGFCINKVVIAREDRRFYEIISACEGEQKEFDYLLPPRDKLVLDEDALEFYVHKAQVIKKAMEQAKNSTSVRGGERLKEMENRYNSICEVIKECQQLMM